MIGTDPSAQQLEHAVPHPRVEYRVGPAEASGLPDASVDLVAAAQAFHWFDFDRFFAEARRVLAPGGAVAVWTYNLARVSPRSTPGPTGWPTGSSGPGGRPSASWVDEEYRTIPFPFPEVEAPPFVHARATGTWTGISPTCGPGRPSSATSRRPGRDPIEESRRRSRPPGAIPRRRGRSPGRSSCGRASRMGLMGYITFHQ